MILNQKNNKKMVEEQTSLTMRLIILFGIIIGTFSIFFICLLPFIILDNIYGLIISAILLPIGFGLGVPLGEKLGIF